MAAYNLTRLRTLAQLRRNALNEWQEGRNDPVRCARMTTKWVSCGRSGDIHGCMTSPIRIAMVELAFIGEFNGLLTGVEIQSTGWPL